MLDVSMLDVKYVCCGRKTCEFSTHGERAHCHDGAPNYHCVTVQVVCAECSPSDALGHYSRTRVESVTVSDELFRPWRVRTLPL